MLFKKSNSTEFNNEIKPINGPAKYSYRFKDFTEISLINWPPAEFKKFGWNEAQKEIKRHWRIISNSKIWSPYPIQAYCIGSSEAPGLINALSGNDNIISSLLQQDINEYLKVKVRYFLFPLANSQYQHQAVAQLICETMPDAKTGEFNAWIDALQKNELSPENVNDINISLERN